MLTWLLVTDILSINESSELEYSFMFPVPAFIGSLNCTSKLTSKGDTNVLPSVGFKEISLTRFSDNYTKNR